MNDKDKFEKMCRAAGMSPAMRMPLRDYELFLSDGFSLPPHRIYKRFGVDPDDFPKGMYVTFWWLMKDEDNFLAAHPIFFDVDHNPEYDKASKEQGRLNAARKDADNFLKAMDKAAKEQGTVH